MIGAGNRAQGRKVLPYATLSDAAAEASNQGVVVSRDCGNPALPGAANSEMKKNLGMARDMERWVRLGMTAEQIRRVVRLKALRAGLGRDPTEEEYEQAGFVTDRSGAVTLRDVWA